MKFLDAVEKFWGSQQYVRKASKAWAIENYAGVQMQEVAGYICYTLCDVLCVTPDVISKETRLLEDLRMDDIEPDEVSLALKEGGVIISPQEIMDSITVDGLIQSLSMKQSQQSVSSSVIGGDQ